MSDKKVFEIRASHVLIVAAIVLAVMYIYRNCIQNFTSTKFTPLEAQMGVHTHIKKTDTHSIFNISVICIKFPQLCRRSCARTSKIIYFFINCIRTYECWWGCIAGDYVNTQKLMLVK